MPDAYLEVISLAERLHRQFLEMVNVELDRLGIRDINNVQAVMLFNIGDAEMTVGDLTLRGCYLGSNVSYNVKKMVKNGYLALQRSAHDRRMRRVKLTDKGRTIRDKLLEMHHRHIALLNQANMAEPNFHEVATTLRQLERFWTQQGDPASRVG